MTRDCDDIRLLCGSVNDSLVVTVVSTLIKE